MMRSEHATGRGWGETYNHKVLHHAEAPDSTPGRMHNSPGAGSPSAYAHP